MLGQFEERVLLALVAAKGEATTSMICEIYEKDVGKEPSYGALYTCLDRMLEKKFVTRRKGEPEPQRGGKARFFYSITGGGRQALLNSMRRYETLSGRLGIVGA